MLNCSNNEPSKNSLPVQYRNLLDEFVLGLPDYSYTHRHYYLSTAKKFLFFILNKEVSGDNSFPLVSAETIISWLLGLSGKKKINVLRNRLSALSRFLEFLKSKCMLKNNPITPWYGQNICSLEKVAQILLSFGNESTDVLAQKIESLSSIPLFLSTLADLFSSFLLFYRSLGRKYKKEEYILRRFDRFLNVHEIKGPGEVNAKLIAEYLIGIAGLSRSRKNRHQSCLKHFFNYLIRLGIPSLDPSRVFSYTKSPRAIPHIFTIKEIKSLIEEAHKFARAPWMIFVNLTYRTLIHLLYATGMRISEPLSLRICDVDLEHNTIFIRQTKFYKSRLIPIGNKVKSYLTHYLEERKKKYPPKDDQAPFFTSRNRCKLSTNTVRQVFRRLIKRAGIHSRGTHPISAYFRQKS